MKVLHRALEIEPPTGIDRVVLNWYPDKGWVIGFSTGEGLFW